MAKIKKKLTQSEEFEIMKLVMDKFLWLGTIIMAFGLYRIFTTSVASGIYYLFAGALVLIVFMVIMVREYEIIK